MNLIGSIKKGLEKSKQILTAPALNKEPIEVGKMGQIFDYARKNTTTRMFGTEGRHIYKRALAKKLSIILNEQIEPKDINDDIIIFLLKIFNTNNISNILRRIDKKHNLDQIQEFSDGLFYQICLASLYYIGFDLHSAENFQNKIIEEGFEDFLKLFMRLDFYQLTNFLNELKKSNVIEGLDDDLKFMSLAMGIATTKNPPEKILQLFIIAFKVLKNGKSNLDSTILDSLFAIANHLNQTKNKHFVEFDVLRDFLENILSSRKKIESEALVIALEIVEASCRSASIEFASEEIKDLAKVLIATKSKTITKSFMETLQRKEVDYKEKFPKSSFTPEGNFFRIFLSQMS